MSFDQGFADAGEQFCERDRAAILGPGCAIHAHKELSMRKNGALKLNFEIFVPIIILDRNSQICFHNPMIKATDRKVTCAQRRAHGDA